MKNSKFYTNTNRQDVEFWSESIPSGTDFWEKVDGVSRSITERQYLNRLKKYHSVNLAN